MARTREAAYLLLARATPLRDWDLRMDEQRMVVEVALMPVALACVGDAAAVVSTEHASSTFHLEAIAAT